MKVLIIASPRSGSTNLYSYIKLSLGLVGYNEPHRTGNQQERMIKYKSIRSNFKTAVVVKHLFMQIENIGFDNVEYFYDNIENFYDKVILLHREDKQAASESYAAAIKSGLWVNKYTYNDKVVPLKEKELAYKMFIKEAEFIKTLNYPVFTYEEIYYSDEGKDRLDKLLGITDSKYRYKLDTKNRYRHNNLNKTII